MRIPSLSLLPPLFLIAGMWLAVASSYAQTGPASTIAGVLVLLAFVGVPVSAYRLGRDLDAARHQGHDRGWRSHRSGLLALCSLFPFPMVTMLYFQHSLNRVWRAVADEHPRTYGARAADVAIPEGVLGY